MLSATNAGILFLVLSIAGTLVEGMGGMGGTPAPPPANPPNIGYCTYEGVQYQQDESWYTDCDTSGEIPQKMKCTCTDATVGMRSCKGLCLAWDLPDVCTSSVPEGKCCKVPNCPFPITFPDGYEEV